MFVRLTALTMLPLVAAGASAQSNEECFDLAVIIGAPRELEIPGTSDPDDLIGHPTWQLDMTVERVLLGSEKRKRIRAFSVKHARFNPAIKRWLFLLRSRPDGNYEEIGGDYRVITDDDGQLVVPISEPISDDWLFPDGPVPHSYQSLLKSVKYASSQTWWLREFDDGDPEVLDPAWAYRKGKYVVALRGIYLTDWAEAMKREPGAICPKR